MSATGSPTRTHGARSLHQVSPYDPGAAAPSAAAARRPLAKLQELEASLAERDEKLTALLVDREALDDELSRLRAEVAKAKKEAAPHADTHDYSEAETRTHIIDEYLHEAGWPLTDERDREYEVSGMPNQQRTRGTSTTSSGATTASRWVLSRRSARRSLRW